MIPLRKEIQDFTRSCEKLISLRMMSGDEPLSEDERHLIVYYLDELRRLTPSVHTIPES
ncbi:MAG: hypothetical protein H8K07_00660 [Nitrospira sp.]|jgi:hypothetical protein|nr:hypothetical protein [Nitrospira sp.]MDI3465909.1 hypothetical protein [Nitrospira sp.]